MSSEDANRSGSGYRSRIQLGGPRALFILRERPEGWRAAHLEDLQGQTIRVRRGSVEYELTLPDNVHLLPEPIIGTYLFRVVLMVGDTAHALDVTFDEPVDDEQPGLAATLSGTSSPPPAVYHAPLRAEPLPQPTDPGQIRALARFLTPSGTAML